MANTCDNFFQQSQELQKQKQELQRRLEESERARRAGDRFTTAEAGNDVILPGVDGKPRIVNTSDLNRGLQQLADSLDSKQLEDFVDRSMGLRRRPVGSEGQFQNYDRILREIDISQAKDYAKLARALGYAWEKMDPKDYAFVTQVYGRERMAEVMAEALSEFGVTVPEVQARMANDAAGFIGLVERMARIRLFADRTKKKLMAATERLADFMEGLPGAEVPAAYKQDAYKWSKLALLGERHWAFARGQTAKTLRSLQSDMIEGDIPDFIDVPWLSKPEDRLIPGGAEGAKDGDVMPTRVIGPEETLGLTAEDVGPDSVIGRIIDAVDQGPGGAQQLRDIVEALEIEGIDPKAKLDKDWFNTTMRLGRAWVKDSQLSSTVTLIKSGEMPNISMMLYGPLQKTMKNGLVMVPAGTGSLKRLGLLDSAKISAKAYNYALHMTRQGLKKLFKDAVLRGKSQFGGNPDTYGKRMSTNAEVRAEANRIAQQQWATKNFLANVAMAGPKLNVAVRLKLQELWHDMPLQPALRLLGAFDEVHGKFQYMFHLMSDLEVKARAEAVTLELDTPAKRDVWVQDQIEQAIYQVTPTEANIKAYRKQHKLGQMDGQLGLDGMPEVDDDLFRYTDQEVMDLMVKQKVAGGPTFATPASVRAFNYSAEMRMQGTPSSDWGRIMGAEPGTDWISGVDRTVMAAKKDWRLDTIVPYWRAPANATLFDLRLATGPFYDPIKMLAMIYKQTDFKGVGSFFSDVGEGFRKASDDELFQEVAGHWVISLGLLSLFTAVDQAGLITGNTHPDPAKRNSFMGLPYLGGIPILSTLFLWKDVKDAATKAGASDLDGNELFNGVAQVLTGYIMRGTGMAQLQQLVSALGDGNMDAWDALIKFGGFMVKGGYVPFVGAVNSVERLFGMDLANQYQDGKNTPMMQYQLGLAGDIDGPLADVQKRLRDFAYSAVPFVAGFQGNKKDVDWLGSPRGHIAGIDFAKVIPIGFPGAWPNDPIYPELEAMGALDPPVQLRRRNLDGVGMSAALQREFVDIYGSVRGDKLLALNEMTGRNITARYPIEYQAVLPNGVRVKDGETVSIELASYLEKHVRGKKVAEAMRSLFNDPLYQRFEADPRLTSDLSRKDMPQSLRRQQPAQLMIQIIKEHYLERTRNELEIRAREGKSAEAKAWSDAKTTAVKARTKESLEKLQAIINALSGAR